MDMWNKLPANVSGWSESPYAILKTYEIAQRGAVMEHICQGVLEHNGHEVTGRTTSGNDRVVDGKMAEIKGAMVGRDGSFTINQIRPSQDYKHIFMLLLYKNHWELWKADKENYMSDGQHPGLAYQHGGKKAEGNTLIYKFKGSPAQAEKIYEGSDISESEEW